MQRRLLVLCSAVLLTLVSSAVLSACGMRNRTDTAPPSSATASSLSVQDDLTGCASPAIVQPNCGKAPEDAGDRGGALQITVWVLLVAGLAVVFGVVFRSARRTERAKAAVVGDRNWS